MAEEEAQSPPEERADPYDVEQQWTQMAAGPKATALRTLYEEQQKLVVELQRQAMQKGAEIAAAIVRARAAQELQQPDTAESLVEKEIIPKREEFQQLEKQIAEETALLDAYSKIGRGII